MNNHTLQRLKEFAIADSHTINHCFRHYSFLLLRNSILSIGKNNPNKTHPLAFKFGHRFNCIHSELSAITNYPLKIDTLKRCTMVNVRVSRNRQIRISRPCNVCLYMLFSFGITDIIYTDRLGNFVKL